MYRWETFSISPEGGLVENVASLKQGIEMPGSAARLVNFEPSIDGGYRRINGYTKFSATEVTGTGQIFGVAFFEGSSIAVRNGNIYESAGGVWSNIATGRTHTTKHPQMKTDPSCSAATDATDTDRVRQRHTRHRTTSQQVNTHMHTHTLF